MFHNKNKLKQIREEDNMKNYTVNSVLSDLKGAINVRDKVVFVEGQIGIDGWGKIDFLKRNGYTVINKIGLK
jgi:hypothetical protein